MKIAPSGISTLLSKGSWPTTRRLSRALTAIGADEREFLRALNLGEEQQVSSDDSEVRESSDPIDDQFESVVGALRSLVQTVKARTPKP
ncbi:MAG: hypothetical protein ABIU84_03870 [Thermoanaerobaculia bacterium]